MGHWQTSHPTPNIFGTGLWSDEAEPPYMAQQSDDSDVVHDNSWSANLEHPRHGDDRAVVVKEALDAVERTVPGNHVNLVTHSAHGHPEAYLYEALTDRFGDGIHFEYVSQCGCGGHVTRVHVEP
jgi:putative CGCGG family rSAM target protein